EDFTHKLDSRISVFADLKLFDKKIIEKINVLTNQLQDLSKNEKPVLSHTDLSREHIFLNSKGDYVGFIDLDDLRGSNKFLDLAEISKEFSEEDFEHILNGYMEVTAIDKSEMMYEFKLTRIFWF